MLFIHWNAKFKGLYTILRWDALNKEIENRKPSTLEAVDWLNLEIEARQYKIDVIMGFKCFVYYGQIRTPKGNWICRLNITIIWKRWYCFKLPITKFSFNFIYGCYWWIYHPHKCKHQTETEFPKMQLFHWKLPL